MTKRRNLRTTSLVLAVATVGLGAASAQEVTLQSSFPGRGWYNDVGYHRAVNDNTFTGTVNASPEEGSGRGLNAFFVWDLAPLGGSPVGTAKLRLGQDQSFSMDPSETIGIYDVSATRDELIAHYPHNDPRGLAIHEDLQTGAEYGTFATAVGTQEYIIELSGEAVADINASLDAGFFAIGLHSLTDAMSQQDGVRFDQPLRIQELIVTLGGLCSGDESLKLSCKKGKLKAKLSGAEPGGTLTLCLDEADCVEVDINNKGGAKATWKNVSRGNHTVTIQECDVSDETRC